MNRPKPATAAVLRRTVVAFIALAIVAAGGPIEAAVVLTEDGGILQVDSYRVEEGWAHLSLSGGGLLILPVARIERVVDDRAAESDQLENQPPAGFELGIRSGDPVPDTPYGDLIYATAYRHGMSPTLVAAMVRAESAFDPEALSPKGARGLLQLMPATARRFGIASEQLFEPGPNLDAGVRYLAWLNQRFPGDLARILAAYNAGEAQVERYRGVPPFAETREYIQRIYRLLRSSRPAE